VSSEALAATEAVGSDSPLRFLPKAIRVPERPFRAIAVAWLTAFPISIILALLASRLFPDAGHPDFEGGPGLIFFAVVIFSPVVETLIMGTVLLILLSFLPEWVAIVVSAIGWGIAHSTLSPTWGLAVWWPFLILSTLFVAWRKRSLWLAFLLPTASTRSRTFFPGF
jgi:membrane protease YdiL (CAAX protease family)